MICLVFFCGRFFWGHILLREKTHRKSKWCFSAFTFPQCHVLQGPSPKNQNPRSDLRQWEQELGLPDCLLQLQQKKQRSGTGTAWSGVPDRRDELKVLLPPHMPRYWGGQLGGKGGVVTQLQKQEGRQVQERVAVSKGGEVYNGFLNRRLSQMPCDVQQRHTLHCAGRRAPKPQAFLLRLPHSTMFCPAIRCQRQPTRLGAHSVLSSEFRHH